MTKIRYRMSETEFILSLGQESRGGSSSHRLQVCDGIVRSKLPLFDATKRTPRSGRLPFDQSGLFVKSRMAVFDPAAEAAIKNRSNLNRQALSVCYQQQQMSSKQLAEKRLAEIINSQKRTGRNSVNENSK